MANINDILSKILSARYGKDVRQSIHDGIRKCYDDGKAGSVDLYAREQIDKKASQEDLEFERARIDGLLKIPEGPTTADAALYDINIGYDGKDWGSPGNAVRGQVSQLSTDIANLTKHTSDAITVEKSGTTITATDSSDKGFEQFKTFGKSVQDTSGKQLFDFGDNHRSFTVTTQDWIAIYTDINPFTKGAGIYSYSCSNDMNISVMRMWVYDSTDNLLVLSENKESFELTEETIAKVAKVCVVLAPVTTGVNYDGHIYPMINYGSTPLPWEPYTGGIPSPNPEYPQPIVSAGQKLENGIVSDVGISKKLTGKNLLKSNIYTTATNGVAVTLGNDGSVTFNGTATANCYFLINKGIALTQGKYILSGCPSGGGSSTYQLYIQKSDGSSLVFNTTGSDVSFTISDDDYRQGYIAVYNGITASNLVFKPMIRLASIEDDTYEPYTEQTHKSNRVLNGIPLGQTIPDIIKSSPAHMAGVYWDDETQQYYIGDTEDGVNGVYVQRVGTILPTEWVLHNVYSITSGYRFMARINGMANGVTMTVRYIPCVCSHYSFKKTSSYSTQGDYITTDEAHEQGRIYIRTTNEELSSTAKFTEWATANNMLVNYILATPIETPLTDEEIAMYKALHTNKPTTVITNDAGCYMEVEYVADPKNHIEQNYVPVTAFNDVLDRISALEQLHV